MHLSDYILQVGELMYLDKEKYINQQDENSKRLCPTPQLSNVICISK